MGTRPFRNTAPFFLLSAAFIVGHVAALASWDSGSAVAALTGLLALGSAALPLPARATALAVAVSCGSMSAVRTGYVGPEAVRPFLDNEMVFRGTVDSVRLSDSGWRGIAENATVSTLDDSRSIRLKRVAVTIRNPDEAESFPAELRATGRLHPIRSMGNPVEIPREWEALASGTQYVFVADSRKAVLLDCPGTAGLFRAARARTGRWLERVAGRTDGALYLMSLANGQVPPAGHPLVALFRQTGLAHLFAISGINVVVFYAMQAGLVRVVLWLVRMRRGAPDLNRIASLAALPACWFYVLMAGAPIPAVRSAGMVTVAVSLWQFFGARAAGTGLSAMFLLVVASSPFSLLSPSFLLSYGAVFFLVCATGGKGGESGEPERARGMRRTIASRLLGAIECAAVAFCGTLPVSAAFFTGISTGSILWNVLFGPLLGTGGVAGAFLAVAGGVFGLDFLDTPVRCIAIALDRGIACLRTLSGNGGGYFALPPSGAWPMLVSTAVAGAVAMRLRAGGIRAWPAPVAGALAFLAWIHLPYIGLPDSRMSLTALNVGNGASHVIGFPGGGTMVLDCGSAERGDSGNRILVPYLRSAGIREIELLVLSHPHEDHFGGVASLLEAVHVKEIWIPAGIATESFGKALAAFRGTVRQVGKGCRAERGGASIRVRSGGPGAGPGANSSSLVIEARYGRFSAWLPGDVEGGPSAWGAAGERCGEWRALFLPHHGSPGADPEGWAVAAAPDMAVIQNRNCLAGKNLVPSDKIFALDNGAVTILTDGLSVLVKQEVGNRFWRVLCRTS
jgi:competence protein ComEC